VKIKIFFKPEKSKKAGRIFLTFSGAKNRHVSLSRKDFQTLRENSRRKKPGCSDIGRPWQGCQADIFRTLKSGFRPTLGAMWKVLSRRRSRMRI
jgi:hypothetical protein